MESLTDKIVRVLNAFRPFQGAIKIEKVEQTFKFGGREIKTDNYVEGDSDLSLTQRPEITEDNLRLPNIEKTFDEELFGSVDGYINVDVLEERVVTTSLFFSKNDLIRQYKNMLSDEDLSAVLRAYRVCFYEDHNKKEDAEKAKENLIKKNKERGRAIYNFARSALFEGEISATLTKLQDEDSDHLSVFSKFREYFDSLILFHPTNIYVSISWSTHDLLSQVDIRYKKIKACGIQDDIRIYSRSSNRNTVNRLKEIDVIKNTFDYRDEVYYFGKEPAMTTILHIKSIRPHS